MGVALPPTAYEWGYRGPQDDAEWNHYINQWVRNPDGTYSFRPHTGTFRGAGTRNPYLEVPEFTADIDTVPPGTQSAPVTMTGPEPDTTKRTFVPRGTNKALTLASDLLLLDMLARGVKGGMGTEGGRTVPGGGMFRSRTKEGPGLTPPSLAGKKRTIPKIADMARHGELRLRDTRRSSNRLLDMLMDDPGQYNRLNEAIGGGLSRFLYGQGRDKDRNVLSQTLTGGQ